MRHGRDAKRTSRLPRWLYCGAALALLTGCQPEGPAAPFANYLSRLSMALSVEIRDIKPTARLLPPSVAGVQLDVPTGSLDALDFLSLSDCAVQANINKRATSLGRGAKPSQRLLLTLEYLRQTPACIARLRNGNNGVLADTLHTAWRQHQEQLPALIFNATLGSDEYRAFWLEDPVSGGYPRVRHRDSVTALRAINHHVRRWLHGDYQARNREFELLLAEVAGGEGGLLLQLLSRQGDYLATADRILRLHVAANSRCPSTPPTATTTNPAMRIHKIFASRLMPLAASVGQRYNDLQTSISALEAQLPSTLPTRYRRWVELRNRRAAQGARAPDRHIEQIALLHLRCATE